MKYIYTLISMAIVSFVIISINPQTGHTNSSGAPAGKTAAMGEGSCADAGCHGGTATNAPNGITSNIPAAGYESGKTYDITVTADETGKVRFGFQARASAGALEANSFTQLVGGGTYITHRLASTTANDKRVWTFRWVAPASGTGEVTFNAAMLAANGNGTTSGDNVYRSELKVQEANLNGIQDFANAGMSVYPVPFSNTITIEKGNQTFETATVAIYSLEGKKILEKEMTTASINFDTEDLAKGIYIIRLSAGFTNFTQKIAKM